MAKRRLLTAMELRVLRTMRSGITTTQGVEHALYGTELNPANEGRVWKKIQSLKDLGFVRMGRAGWEVVPTDEIKIEKATI